MKLVVDDYRKVDLVYGYMLATSYDECINILNVFGSELEFISLDYSLGTQETGLTILKYLVANGIIPAQINIHSDHSEGVPKMRRYIRQNIPDWVSVTYNRLPGY